MILAGRPRPGAPKEVRSRAPPPPPHPSGSPPVPPYVVALADDLSGAAACALGGPVRLSLDTAGIATPPPAPARDGIPLLFVVGTAEPGAVAQIARLTAPGAHHAPLDPAGLAAGTVRLPPTATAPVLTVLSIDGSAGPRPGAGRALSTALGALAAGYPGRPDLVLTGGETARATLDALGVRELEPLGRLHGSRLNPSPTPPA
ncbi:MULTISPECIES: nucleotide-binding domain containing protein [unclassified Streptomyces]|uniref:nucleotide-binding domain containing protein n=1 Tax=unclassified Streptomyces TaxID=2593676 RepID=UPI003369C91B